MLRAAAKLALPAALALSTLFSAGTAEAKVLPEAVETGTPVEPLVEPMPCGYAVSRMEEQERERKMWLIAGAAGAGGGAVLLGFLFGFRRRAGA